ncbi:NADPH-dependent curcumin reductase CurA [Scopulibacillus daqui]|uniref:NADPH-dependent curcumin reductase CurA n=1 Tax=Scopulibacillus daqui TaxID=1469162 RepID=A0ABS2Q2Y0_9BACL|nr:NADP-dependent oxidoreductase [Scopulibacillus daqui]MBM7646054.1 NADPH-dependent curcumin reductase CurA [Scopulibacillus daqui]
MAAYKAKQILLAKRPKGMPTLENFKFQEIDVPEPALNEVLIKTLYVSVDPYMRGRMSDRESYVPPFELHKVISGGVVGEVIESKSPDFNKGDFVVGQLGWQTYQLVQSEEIRKIDENLAPITAHLGVLGMPGLTAYFGMLDIGQPKNGETVVISGAAGAVGSTAGQIAKIKGARVIGIAGTKEKLSFLKNELGFDEVINYKEYDVYKQLKNACPNGIDVYFDNVGGEISDAVMKQINHQARIVICGQISLYNLEKADVGPRPQTQLVIKSALMKGYIVSDYASQFKDAAEELAQWMQAGQIKYRETIIEGFERIPEAFLGLFKGDNIGKYLVKI